MRATSLLILPACTALALGACGSDEPSVANDTTAVAGATTTAPETTSAFCDQFDQGQIEALTGEQLAPQSLTFGEDAAIGRCTWTRSIPEHPGTSLEISTLESNCPAMDTNTQPPETQLPAGVTEGRGGWYRFEDGRCLYFNLSLQDGVDEGQGFAVLEYAVAMLTG